jgi:hypothetical protein
MRDLIVWDTIDDTADIALESGRIEYLYYGDGSYPETKDIAGLQSPRAIYSMGGSNAHFSMHPNAFTCRIYHKLGAAQLNGYELSEMALLAYSARLGGYQYSFYRTFEPILKTSDFEMETYWDLTF